MATSLVISRIGAAIRRFEHAVVTVAFGRRPPPDEDAFCLALAGHSAEGPRASQPPTFLDSLKEAFLWAVPRNRRTLEKRHKRKYGHTDYIMKIIQPKTTLRTCNVCGDDHEVGVLCPTCYKKVMDETREMQDAIQNELKLSPVENEVVVIYEGEKDDKPEEFWQGKRIVELKKARPPWFSKNLLEQTTQQPATTSDVKPSQLA